MQRLVQLLCLMLILGLTVGCSSQNDHIQYENGQYYLVSEETQAANSTDNSTNMEVIPSLIFPSISEMISDIKNYNFTDEERAVLCDFDHDQEGRILIFDLNNPYEPVFPNDVTQQYKVHWLGASYYCRVKGDISISIHSCSKEYAESRVEEQKNFKYVYPCGCFLQCPIIKESVEDRNAIVCTNTHGKGNKQCFYSFPVGADTYYVYEQYTEAADTIPYQIDLYGCSNGQYFSVRISSLDERPSIEWLSQFSIREFETN